jgi:CheY-like chemotaxis protein
MLRSNILLVDDEQDILMLGISALRDAGFTVQGAISGDIAMILIEQGLQFDLLVTDIVMPGLLDGFALAKRVREVVPEVPILYSTGFTRAANARANGIPEGQVLLKPWLPSELVTAVEAAIAPHR